MITYELHPVHEVLEFLQSYEEEHFADIRDKSLYPKISMNWEVYEELSKEGLCVAVLMKEDDKTIGYSCYTITVDLNNNSYIQAIGVALFIIKEKRGGLIIDFIKECDKLLFEKEVRQVLYAYSDIRIGKILEKANYRPKSITWAKNL